MDVIDLLFRRLVLAARAAGALERPVTVGEILDTFVPYGAARRDGGLDTHDDYLHGLMRLASGERSLLFGDDLMQDDLKAELETPNPDLSVLRTYAQTKVRISSAGVTKVLEGDTAIDLRPPTPLTPAARVPPAPEPRGSTPLAGGLAVPRPATPTQPRASAPVPASGEPAGGQAAEPRTQPARRDAPGEPFTEPRRAGGLESAFAAYQGSQQAPGTDEGGCPYCAQALPTGRQVKFCPSCGQNLLVKRCPGCSAEIETGWKFCVTCGRKA